MQGTASCCTYSISKPSIYVLCLPLFTMHIRQKHTEAIWKPARNSHQDKPFARLQPCAFPRLGRPLFTGHYPPSEGQRMYKGPNAIKCPSISRNHFLKQVCASVCHVEPFTPAVAFCWQQQVLSVKFRLDQPKSVDWPAIETFKMLRGIDK